jgi:hypothetical protein
MAKKKPTFAQAQLQLQLYELRREPRLRLAREWFLENYFGETLEETGKLTPPGSEHSAFARMVTTYWDQACALLNYGLLHENLFFETTGEFFAVWERLRPIVPELRKRYGNPSFYQHMEKAGKRYEAWLTKRSPGWAEQSRKYWEQIRAAKAAKTS